MQAWQDDERLARDAVACKAGAFERIVRDNQRLVWHVVQRLVHHPDDARELCQEAFLRVHRHLHQYRGQSSLATWIGRVAYTVALRHLEKQRLPLIDDEDGSLMAAVPADDDPLAELGNAQAQALLAQAIAELAPLQQLVLTLYHLQELPIAEVARITGLAEGTIKSHLHRSRSKLRAALAPALGERPHET